MKIELKKLAWIAFIFATMSQAFSQGYIVPNGVVANFGASSPDEISVLHNPANPASGASYTGFLLHPQGRTPPSSPSINTFQFDPIVDIGVRVFFVSANDPISLQPIHNGSYQELTIPNSYVFNSGSPFYVGLYTGNQSFAPQDGIYSDPLFGWARLVNNNGVIQLLDSALVYQGGGIIAGTQTIIPVPEPTTFGLAAVGLIVLSFRQVRRRG